ncbi:MAG: DAK2 domain-containing protein, partial [Candidatus Dormibacteraceae bacterium]
MSPIGLAVGDRCDGVAFREGVADATTLLERRVGLIDALNVFPVPDGDTGSNLALTMRAATEAARSQTSSAVGDVAEAIARGALIGAHGNSGVILSRYFQGLAQSLRGRDVLNSSAFAAALKAGADAARAAVDRPFEGTMLTVASDAARAASATARSGAPLAEVIGAAAREAGSSAERTRGALPSLRQADVVDAGALGLATILEGIAHSLRGEPLPREIAVAPPRPAALDLEAGRDGYCTEFVVRGTDLRPDRIRRRLRGLGDSLLAVGDSSTVRVHLHTLTPGDAVERGAAFGAVDDLKVEDMRDQNRRLRAGRAVERERCGLLVVADGDGLVDLLRSLGAVVVPNWRQLRVVVSAIDGLVRAIAGDDALILVDAPARSVEIQEALRAGNPRETSVTVRAMDNAARS